MKKTSLIIPLFNSAAALPATLRTLQDFFSGKEYLEEIIFVSDGGLDESAALIRAFQARTGLPVRLIERADNRGKGASVKEGVFAASERSAYVFFTDDDLPFGVEVIERMYRRFVSDPHLDLLVGDRTAGASRPRYPLHRRAGGYLFSLLLPRFVTREFPDTQCGLKGFKTEIAKQIFARIRCARWTFDAEILLLALQRRLRIEKVPVLFRGEVTGTRFTPKDAFAVAVELARLRIIHALARSSLHHTALCACLALFFAGALLYGFPDSPSPWFDDGIHLNLARTLAEEGVLNLETAPGVFVNEKPLLITTNYPLLLPVALSFKLFGVGLWQAKIVMAGFLIAFVCLAYALARKLYGKESALLAFALLVTFLPLYGNGKSVLGEIPGLVFFLGGLLFVGRGKEPARTETDEVHSGGWPTFFAGFLFGLAAATKSSFLIMLPAVAAGEAYGMWQRRQFNLDRLLLLSIGASIPLIVWVWTLIPQELTAGFLQQVIALYRNPYGAEGVALPNLLRFVTESTPLHYALLLGTVLVAASRRRLAVLSREEVTALVFIGLNLLFYLTTVGWYRYFFPSHALLLVLFSGAAWFLFTRPLLRLALLSGLLLIQLGVFIVNIREPLYHNGAPRQFGEAASEIIGEREVVVIDNPEIAFFVQSENRRLYLQANPRFVFGQEPFADGRLPRFIVGPAWQAHPYLQEHLSEKGNYTVAFTQGRHYLYELSQ